MPAIPEKAALKLCENALDWGYAPKTLGEAMQIIGELRRRVDDLREGVLPERLAFGMRKQEWMIYCALRGRGVRSTRALMVVLYGGRPKAPKEAAWCVRHAVRGVREKLPAGECIQTVYGEGYLWQETQR